MGWLRCGWGECLNFGGVGEESVNLKEEPRAKTHRMHYQFRLFPAKEPYD